MSIEDKQLKTVSKLAEYQLILENKIKQAEEDLATLKEQFKQVSQTDLPEALAETGLSEIKLTDGSKISVQQFYNASIPKDNLDEAFTCSFGRGEDGDAKVLKEELSRIGVSYTEKVGVHPQTLKAFVREQVESGQNLPLDLLGVYIGQKTVIKGG